MPLIPKPPAASGPAAQLGTTGAPVTVNTAAPPSAGQVLTATSPTAADWAPAGGGGSGISRLYTSDGAQTISNTSSQLTVLDHTAPSIAGNSMAVGDKFEWEFWGNLSTDATPPATLQLISEVAGSFVAFGSLAPIASLVNAPIRGKVSITVNSIGASGSLSGDIAFSVTNPDGSVTSLGGESTRTIDTTAATIFDLQAKFSAPAVDNALIITQSRLVKVTAI